VSVNELGDSFGTHILSNQAGWQRGLVGEIIRRFEAKGFTLVGLKFMMVSRELAEQHYDVHREKPFFTGLVEFITSGPVGNGLGREGVVAAGENDWSH